MERPAHRPLVLGMGGRRPTVGPAAWIGPTASAVGAVTLGAGVNVWYDAVMRADDETVTTVGPNTNAQGDAVLHADPGSPACSVMR